METLKRNKFGWKMDSAGSFVFLKKKKAGFIPYLRMYFTFINFLIALGMSIRTLRHLLAPEINPLNNAINIVIMLLLWIALPFTLRYDLFYRINVVFWINIEKRKAFTHKNISSIFKDGFKIISNENFYTLVAIDQFSKEYVIWETDNDNEIEEVRLKIVNLLE